MQTERVRTTSIQTGNYEMGDDDADDDSVVGNSDQAQ